MDVHDEDMELTVRMSKKQELKEKQILIKQFDALSE
jgi:hypothetical protein